MPTYTNSSAALIQLKDLTFGPNEVKEILYYLDISSDTTGYISLSSDYPYYNPIYADTTVTGTDETVVHTLYSSSSSSIRLIPVFGDIQIYFNSTGNAPALTVKESISIDNRGKITRLHVVFTGAGELLIQENK